MRRASLVARRSMFMGLGEAFDDRFVSGTQARPDARRAVIRLVGSVLAEQNDEWAVARRYFSAEFLAKLSTIDSHDPLPAPGMLEGVA
jgi:hypothetical protein